jgi:hypothetical protein
MHGDFTYLFNVIGMKVFGHNELIELINSLVVGHSKLTELTSLVDILGCNGLVSLIGLGLDDFIGLGLVSLVRLIDCISLVGPICFSGISGLIGQISLVSLSSISGISGISGISSRISHNGLVGLIGISLVSLLGLIGHIGFGYVSFIGLSLLGFMDLGLAGLINDISLIGPSSHNGLVGFMGLGLVGLIGLGHVSLIGQISLVGQISLIRLISHIIGHNCLDGVIGLGLVSLFGLVGHSGINDLMGLNSLIAAIIAAAKFLVAMVTQAAAAKTHGVAIKLASATKITNASIWYYCAALLLVLLSLIRRESGLWCEWRIFSSLAGLDSVFENALQNAKQLFHVSLPQMMKYCVMRECENILCGYLYDGDLAFVILKGISSFKFPKRFWRSLPEISLLLFFFS